MQLVEVDLELVVLDRGEVLDRLLVEHHKSVHHAERDALHESAFEDRDVLVDLVDVHVDVRLQGDLLLRDLRLRLLLVHVHLDALPLHELHDQVDELLRALDDQDLRPVRLERSWGGDELTG